jgi:hypothetical protein
MENTEACSTINKSIDMEPILTCKENLIKNGTILKGVLKPETTDNIEPFSFAWFLQFIHDVYTLKMYLRDCNKLSWILSANSRVNTEG